MNLHNIKRINENRVEDLNKRIFERNIPSRTLQQQFSVRPVSTKFTKFQTLSENETLNNNEKINMLPTYNIQNDFNPGSTAPPQGYINNIDDESRLNRQFFSNQNSFQSKWIPSTESSLYKTDKVCWEDKQPFPKLFEDFNSINSNINKLEKYNVGKDLWQNSTRQQLKNIK